MTNDKEPVKVELIGKDIAYIQKDIAEIKSSIKELTGVYITKIQFDDVIKVQSIDIEELKKSRNLWRWLGPTLSAILGSAVTFLLINYLQNLK